MKPIASNHCEEQSCCRNTLAQLITRVWWVNVLLLWVVSTSWADIDPRYRNRGGRDGCLPPCCQRNPETGKVDYFCFEYRLKCYFLVLRSCYFIPGDLERASGGNCPPR